VRAKTISPRFTARTLLTCLSCSEDLTSLASRSNIESPPAWPNSTAKRRMTRDNVPLGPTTKTRSSDASETPAISFHMTAPAEPPKCESGVGVGPAIQSISSNWRAACSAPYVSALGSTPRGPNALPTNTHFDVPNCRQLPPSVNPPLDDTTIGRIPVQPMPTLVDSLWDDEFLSMWSQPAAGVRYVESVISRAISHCAAGSETGRVRTDKRSIRSLQFRSRPHSNIALLSAEAYTTMTSKIWDTIQMLESLRL
jgi:hypothetical protein